MLRLALASDKAVAGSDGAARPPLFTGDPQRKTIRHETEDTVDSEATGGTGTYTILGSTFENGEVHSDGVNCDVPRSPTDSSGGLEPHGPHRLVSRALHPWQIFLIVISGTIGLGLFADSGELLRIAGPGGAMLAFALVGAGVICVMTGLAEMINHWPISNALFEFVRGFVDGDLAILLGIAYWGAYSITFGTLVSAMLDLAKYWSWPQIWEVITFGIVPWALMVVINLMGVKWYGYIESFAGILKLLLLTGCFLIMIAINNGSGKGTKIGSKYINEGFKNDPKIASSPFIAILVAIPIATYAFGGVEIIAVTAIEARDPSKSLKRPSRSIAIILAVAYLLSVLGFYLNVSWRDPSLPSMSSRANQHTTSGTPVVLIATGKSNIPGLSKFLNGCLIMAVFSAANTTLYVASRTLFGLTKTIKPDGPALSKLLYCLGTTNPSTRVPSWAVVVSALAFVWLPVTHVASNFSDRRLQEIMSGIATVSVILVWASQCLAFIRYRLWLSRHDTFLIREFKRYSVHELNRGQLSQFQPLLAWIGLIGCLATVFVFSTASWWRFGEPSASNVLATWTVPGVLLISWVTWKYCFRSGSGRWWVTLSDEWKILKLELMRLNNLEKRSSDDRHAEVGIGPETRRLQSGGVLTQEPASMPNATGSLALNHSNDILDPVVERSEAPEGPERRDTTS